MSTINSQTVVTGDIDTNAVDWYRVKMICCSYHCA